MTAPRLHIRCARATWRAVALRLPFRFGDVTVTEAREAYFALEADTRDGPVRGVAAQLMVPRWFDKRPDQSADDTVRTLARSVLAAKTFIPDTLGTVADLSAACRAATVAAMPDTPPLAAGFGPALAEAALCDLAAKMTGLSFAEAARVDAFGLAETPPDDLDAEELRAFLAGLEPVRHLRIRHTIGFDAPLARDPDLGPEARPTTLADVIDRQGITAFKIKLKGDPEADLDRLRAVAAIVDAGPAYRATLDANEQYAPGDLPALLTGLDRDPALSRLRASLAFVEQPVDRDEALAGPAPASDVPLLIDEADGTPDAFATALGLGWSGTSVKSCKGVLRALLNGARARRAGALLSAEDLTCQPGLAWSQDAVMAATLGLKDAERNGHHFAGGMQGAADTERAAFAEANPETYAPDGGLCIKAGRVAIGSLVDAPGLGSTPLPDISGDTEIDLKDF